MREFLNYVLDLIRKAPAGGLFHDASFANATYGVGGGAFDVVLRDGTRYHMTFTKVEEATYDA